MSVITVVIKPSLVTLIITSVDRDTVTIEIPRLLNKASVVEKSGEGANDLQWNTE